MNEYIAGILAREHHDMLLADAVAARLARSARSGRRLRAQRRRPGWTGSPAARVVARPVSALHTWIAAGQL
ncbi:MAG: hypothetical protein QOG01_939 [Pseudonocardiales bacterium]|jgi:hypothetical protein|nr:hypothetical protein [Pseudonocardiales bacterium]